MIVQENANEYLNRRMQKGLSLRGLEDQICKRQPFSLPVCYLLLFRMVRECMEKARRRLSVPRPSSRGEAASGR